MNERVGKIRDFAVKDAAADGVSSLDRKDAAADGACSIDAVEARVSESAKELRGKGEDEYGLEYWEALERLNRLSLERLIMERRRIREGKSWAALRALERLVESMPD